MNAYQTLKIGIEAGDFRILARALTLVENDIEPGAELLKSLDIDQKIPVLGITGPPGSGKSTLVSAIATALIANGKKIAVLAVDPTSPFNFGSLLGDRIRMGTLFNHPNVYIRSIATRGALGGVSLKTLEMVDLLKAAKFDLIILETVGVGQSEVEVAGLADKTVVVLVPEAGDEIQNIKSGIMEIAQAFVVNKADREGADTFANNLKKMMNENHQQVPVFKTIAAKNEGISELTDWILKSAPCDNEFKQQLIAEKAIKLIQHARMKTVDQVKLRNDLNDALTQPHFNIYQFIEKWMSATGIGLNDLS